MAKWIIQTGSEREKRNSVCRTLYGDEGFEERKAVAALRVSELEQSPKYSDDQATVFGGQFEQIAMGANDVHWPKLREASFIMWIRLVCQIAGIS